MSIFGLDGALVTELVTGVSTGFPDRDDVEERFARAAWSGIAEPGDRLAGIVVASLGAARALGAIIERWSAERLVVELETEAPDVAELAQAIERWTPRLTSQTVVRSLGQAARVSARLLIPSDELWPHGLDDLGAFGPLALWVRGGDAALQSIERGFALVGARAATGYGEHVAMEASAGLVDRGYSIISGAAYGIDGMAHRAALASNGHTVAFLAGGVDRFYPSGHDALLTRIAEHGAVISEVPCGVPPTKWRFLQRNRLIAASSLATVVLEAGWRSGSLNTAGHAAALGRPLGAVPGPVTSAASAGCHRLIRDYDAVCVTSAEEMAELAPIGGEAASVALSLPPSRERSRLFDAMSARSARPVADIAARAGMSSSEVQAMLGELELDGLVAERERGWVLAR
jgi:DNA processing protein